MHRQFATATQGIATHRRNQGLFDASNADPVLKTAQQHIDRRLVRHFFDVGSGCKRFLACTGDDHAANLFIAIKLL